MEREETEEATVFLALVNHEDQYSIWPEVKPLPPGWRPAGMQGSKPECLAWIGRAWTDMTPASLRRR